MSTVSTSNLTSLTEFVLRQLTPDSGRMLALAGPPAGGKSTLATELCETLNRSGKRCSVVPMDGFHLDNRILEAQGLLKRKGSPPSFDSLGFVHLIKRIHASVDAVYAPVFDRERDIAIAGAQRIDATDDVVIVEGNYLLLKQAPWNELGELFAVKLFLNPGLETVEQRILARWKDAGFDENTIQERVYGNDLLNAKTVLTESNTTGAIELDLADDITEYLI